MKMHATHRGWWRPWQVLLLLGLVALFGLTGCGASSSLTGPVLAATVNGNGIGLDAYQSIMTFAIRASAGTPTSWQLPTGRQTQASLQPVALNFLIDLELAREQAEACGVKITQQDIATQQKQLQSTANSVLKDPTNSEWQTFHALVTTPHVLGLYSQQQAYEVALTKVLKVPTANVSYILVSTQKQAESLLQQAEHGANFAQLGQQAQSAPNSTASYSDLGAQYIGEFLPQFDSAVFADAKPSKPGCYNNLSLNKAPERFRVFALSGQNAGQYMVVETTAVGNAPLSALNNAQNESTVFNAWLDEIVRLPGNSTVEKYILPVTTAS